MPIRMNQMESGLRAALRYIEAFNRHSIGEIGAILSPGCLMETPFPAPDGTSIKGRDAICQKLQEEFRKNPEAELKVEHTGGSGHNCVLRWRFHPTPATSVRGVFLMTEKNDLICEILSYVKCG